MLFTAIFALNYLYFVSSNCPSNSFPYQSNCYIFNSTETGFASAEIECRQIGGHLASIHDAFTNAAIGQEAKNFLHESTMSDLWIGATKLLSNGNWNWTDGADFNYKDWKPKEPQNTTDLNCASMSLDDDYWASKNCNELKPYVCQILASTPAPTYPPIANCSHGWSYFAPTHSCYGVNEHGYIANWTAAETYCQNNDAHLSSIHSYYELQYLTSYFFVAWSYSLWTGINSVDSGKTWKSSDGSPTNFLNYASWCQGNPISISGEQCVAIDHNDGKECYANYDCTLTPGRTICKKSLFV